MANITTISGNPKIEIFHSEQFGDIRTEVSNPNNPLFCLFDVRKTLGLTNVTELKKRLNPKGLSTIEAPTNGGPQKMHFVDEPNLYRCIFQSRKAEAEVFQDWVVNEVLPSIRKTGGYMVSRIDDTPEDIMARAVLIANDAIKRKDEQLRQLEQRVNQQNNALELKDQFIEELAPDAEYTREVLKSDSTFNATQIAKEFGWGAPTLNEKLRQLGVQYKQNGQWLLTYKYQGKGYTEVDTYSRGIGEKIRTFHNTVWTEKGRQFIHELIKKANLKKA